MPGRSTFTTSAPWSASRVAAYGPVRAIDRSSTLTPARGPSLVRVVVVSSPVDVMPVPPASSVVPGIMVAAVDRVHDPRATPLLRPAAGQAR